MTGILGDFGELVWEHFWEAREIVADLVCCGSYRPVSYVEYRSALRGDQQEFIAATSAFYLFAFCGIGGGKGCEAEKSFVRTWRPLTF